MRPRTGAVLFFLILLSAGAAAQTGAASALKTTQIGDNATLTATVVNPLPVQDRITVTVEGAAVDRIVTPHFPSACLESATTARCTLVVDAESRANLSIPLEGKAIGQETLTATVNSTTSSLVSQDQIEVRVEGKYGTTTVSGPALTFTQIAAVLLLAATVWVGGLHKGY